MTVYRCEDSLEGVFTAIYTAYEEKRSPVDTCLSLDQEPVLFAEDITVVPDALKTGKVMRTLNRRFGEKDSFWLCMTLASEDREKAQAVYRTVADGLGRGAGQGHLFDNLADDHICRAFALARNVSREIDHLRGFVRFRELADGVLYSAIGPKNNVLTFLMPHFADRLPSENFVIYDDKRNWFGVHPAWGRWYLLCGEEEKPHIPGLSEEEAKMQELFKGFCGAITIQHRRNPQLQRNMLPLRFREYMTEFTEKSC